MPYFKSASPVRLASLSGYVVVITPDEPALVPDAIVQEAYAAGCVQVDEELPRDSTALSAEDQEAELKSIIQALIAKNDPKDFNTDGSPRVWSVRKTATFPATGEAIRAAYEALSLEV